MGKLSLTAAISAGILLAGCQNLGLTRLKQHYISVAEVQPRQAGDMAPGTRRTIGSVFIWSNDVNAAVVYTSGDVCAQRALTVLESDMAGSADLSAALLQYSTAVTQPGGQSDEKLLELAGTIKETAKLLTTTTERTAFLDVGMFYLCQLAGNEAIDNAQTTLLTETLVEAAGGLD